MDNREKTLAPMFKFRMEQYGPDGRLKAVDEFHNTVVTVGKNLGMDTVFRAGTGPAWFMGQKGTGNPAVGDTMASHAGWAEGTNYGSTNRLTMSFAACVGGTSTHAPGTYAMNAAYSVAGAFVTTGTVVGGTVGTLYSAGDISTLRTGGSGDTLVITPTLIQA